MSLGNSPSLLDLTATDLLILINALRKDIVRHQTELASQNASDRDWDQLTPKEATLIKLQYQQCQLANRL